ncbi:LysR family transcriptional regulator [Sneathiella aquimaris]|uniref:LysR family transcriptional regulator n=1 Tax=Sneathiella aquimaris TaxID=2599305 RepID=UPI001FE3090F|nr:LysR family transcriptional regulator [Sneathiella aquimaris]
MELSQIKYFLNLADTLNFTEAAKLSNIAQPSLTKSIIKLEERLGGRLVFRDGKNTRLTALGREVLVEFTKIAQIEESILELAGDHTSGNRLILNLGVSTTVSSRTIAQFINFALRNIPSLEISLHPIQRLEAIDALLSGSLDGCFIGDVPMENRKISVIHLFEEVFHVASSRCHKFSAYEDVPLSELRGETYVDRLHCEFRSRILEYFMKQDILMEPRFASEREDWVQKIVASGDGVCILPKHSVTAEGILTRPVNGLDLTRSVVFASVSGSGNSLALQKFRALVGQFCWDI